MVIGVAVWQLEIIGCQSLKEKRSVIRSLKTKLHNRFNVSVAETAHQDLWQRAELTACVAATDSGQADSVLESAHGLVANEYRARIITVERRFVKCAPDRWSAASCCSSPIGGAHVVRRAAGAGSHDRMREPGARRRAHHGG